MSTSESSVPRRMPYLPGLDGLRALAVIAVLLYHADVSWLPSGFLGVEVFFVLSGYLITALLLEEHAANGAIDLKGFWQRRARRLLPALLALLAVVTMLAAAFWRAELPGIREAALASLAYVMNWFLIFSDQPYFETFGRPPPLQHLWSLAVEEQFYLIWPLAVVALLKLGGRRALFTACAIGVVASTALMWVLYEPFVDPSRIYYGTDTRAAGLLLGAGMAVVYRPWNEPRGAMAELRGALSGVGLIGLVGLGIVMHRLNEFDDLLYQGGFLLTAALTVLAIAGLAVADSPLSRVMGRPTLVWIGRRSYAIYLWHWPIFVVTRPGFDITADERLVFALRMVLTLIAADLSYRLVERPWLQRRFGLAGPTPAARRGRIVAGLTVAVVVAVAVLVTPAAPSDQVAAAGVVNSELSGTTVVRPATPEPPTVSPSSTPDRPAPAPTAPTPIAGPVPTLPIVPSPGVTDVPGPDVGDLGLWGLEQQVLGAPAPPVPGGASATPTPKPVFQLDLSNVPTPTPVPPPRRVLAIGDSVLLGSIDELDAALAFELVVDAEVGRHYFDAPRVLESHHQAGTMGDVVVLHLGNNSAISDQILDDAVRAAGDRPVVVVNVAVPRRWEPVVNDTIARAPTRWPNVTIVDWHAAASGRTELFAADGVHPAAAGRALYAQLVADAVLTAGR